MSHRAVFLDRDGTLIEHYDFLTDASQVQLLPHTAKALRRLRDKGFVLVVVSNQSGVARGIFTEETVRESHDRLKELLAEQGAYLDQIYYCPYHPDGAIEKYRRTSELRKPAPGMLLLAAQEMDIDLSQSWMIGDDDRDILAGQAARCRTILIDSHKSSALVHRGQAQPDYRAVHLLEAANLVMRYADLPVGQTATSTAEEGPSEVAVSIPNETAAAPFETITPPESPVPAMAPQELFHDQSAGEPAAQNLTENVTMTESPPTDTPAKRDFEPALSSLPAARAHRKVNKATTTASSSETNALLNQILREMQKLNRHQRFTEFSVLKLSAILTQMLVFFCLVMAYWFGSGPNSDMNMVHNCLLVGLIFQIFTLTLLFAHRG